MASFLCGRSLDPIQAQVFINTTSYPILVICRAIPAQAREKPLPLSLALSSSLFPCFSSLSRVLSSWPHRNRNVHRHAQLADLHEPHRTFNMFMFMSRGASQRAPRQRRNRAFLAMRHAEHADLHRPHRAFNMIIFMSRNASQRAPRQRHVCAFLAIRHAQHADLRGTHHARAEQKYLQRKLGLMSPTSHC